MAEPERPVTRIEVLTVRDPDSATEVYVFVDGALVEPHEEHVDPGAGHLLSEWEEQTAVIEADQTLTPAFREFVVRQRNEALDSPYIEED